MYVPNISIIHGAQIFFVISPISIVVVEASDGVGYNWNSKLAWANQEFGIYKS